MRQCELTAELEIGFPGTDPADTEYAYPTVLIEYTYSPGSPARGPSYSSGGQPAEAAEVELVKATLKDGDGLNPTPEQLDQWAIDYLESEKGCERACNLAEES